MKKKLFFIFVTAIVCLTFFSFQYHEKQGETNDPPLILKYQGTKDTSILVFRITNSSTDTIVFPLKYIQSDISFEDQKIYRRRFISCKIAYPVTIPSFSEMPKKHQEAILKGFCSSYKEMVDLQILAPNDSVTLSFDIQEKDFANYYLRKEYKGRMSIYISEELKKLCPRIWTGSLEAFFPYTFSTP